MICTSSQPESRQEPLHDASVSSGVCTPGLHAHEIAHLLLQDLIEPHQQERRVLAGLDGRAEVVEPRRELRTERRRLEERNQLLGERGAYVNG